MSLFDDDTDLEDVEAREVAALAPAFPDPRANPDLSGHEAAERQVLEWWQSGRVPHTLVLTGPAGIGKATLAFRIARFLLAKPQAGGDGLFGPEPAPENLFIPRDHPIFAQVSSGGHPDLMTVMRTANEKTGRMHDDILVDDVRVVPLFLRKTAADGGWRVVIVDEADTLNRNAQNALLKILEEPPSRTLLILIAGAAGALIPTIRSRARMMPLEPPSSDVFSALMRKHRPDLSAADIELLGRVAEGAPGRANVLLEQGGMAALRGVFSMLDTLPAADDRTIWTMAEKLAVRGEPDPLMGMLDVSTWVLRDHAYCAGRGDGRGLQAYLRTLDALAAHRTTCDKGNLDRRHLALGALRILQNGMKAA